MNQDGRLTIVVVGNGMVGHKLCEKLLKKSSGFNIVVFGEEPRVAYDRVHLSEFFNGKSADDLSLSGISWYQKTVIAILDRFLFEDKVIP